MIKRLSFFLVALSTLGLNACAYSKALETYNSKSCKELRKTAQEQFLGRTPISQPSSRDDDTANEILEAVFQGNERIDNQAKSRSYNRRCQ
ncbi:MAG: hypothetical protein ABJ275_12230 [Maricaulaceae bacterium]